MMEKSGCLTLTQREIDLADEGIVPVRALIEWDISTVEEFKAMLAAGQYRIVDAH